MKKTISLFCMALLCLSGCVNTTPEQTPSKRDDLACESQGIVIDFNFENARVNECVIENDQVTILITPENKPINDSPWYAFKASSDIAKEVKFTINYQGGHHRYRPKMSIDGEQWTPIKYRSQKNRLRFKLPLTAKSITVAGQEIINNQDYVNWMNTVSTLDNVNYSILGKSAKQRDIGQLEITSPENKEWVVVLGRMHPPEVTGALALFPFVESLMENSEFRERFNILVVPNLNPDGVAMGNWRHNANGVDLNRDWKLFKQAESKLVRDKLNEITQAGGNIVFALDFHSTHKDVFYTMPSDYGLNPPLLVEDWLGNLERKTPSFKVRKKPGNNPDKGVFKQFIADKYKIHAITYEMGDSTDRTVIKNVAHQAGNTLMNTLMNTPKSEFRRADK